MTISAVGSLVQVGGTTGQTSVTVTPTTVGNAVLLLISTASATLAATGVSGGSCTWAQVGTSAADTGIPVSMTLWLGTATSTTAATATITYNTAPGTTTVGRRYQEFTAGLGSTTVWSIDKSGQLDTTTASTTVTYPSLTATGSNELYFGHAVIPQVGAAGSTTGFAYVSASNGNIFAYNTASSGTLAPTASQSPAGLSLSIAGLFTASIPVTTVTASATLAGAGSLAATPTVKVAATATLAGAGSLVAGVGTATTSTLAAAGSLAASPTLTSATTATLSGAGSLSATTAPMAAIVGTPTVFSHTLAQGATFTVTIPAVTASNKLVMTCAGGALASAKLTNTSGAAFTLRSTYGGGAQDVSIQDVVVAGGETAVFVTLNGAENVSGTIYEVSGLGAFIGASNNGSGASTSVAGDFQSRPTASVNVASGAAVAFGIWSAGTTTVGADVKWRQVGPFGKMYGSGANQPGSATQFVWASGLADVSTSARWPLDLASAGDYRITSTFVSSNSSCFVAQALYVNAGSAIVPAAANTTVTENTLPGTHVSNWFLGASGTNANIAGFCDKASYTAGSTVNFKVDSGNGAFRVEIYRLGHYGYDLFGARNQLGAQGGYITGTPTVQAVASVDGTLGSSSCAWTTNATWTVPAGATPGVYYVLFRSTVTSTNVSSGHFVVTGSAAGKMAVVLPDLTYQAYNLWGATSDLGGTTYTGRSLYGAGVDGATLNFAHRAYAVSFDRPYGTQSSLPSTYLFDAEMEFLSFCEAQGYPMSYHSSLDLDANTTLLNSASLVAFPGHHEYWTTNVYSCVQNAVDAGVNLHFASSNTALWRTRFAAADTNRRTMVCYKDSASRDVSAGFTGTGYDPLTPTGTWRDSSATNGFANPDRRVEDALTGQIFEINGPTSSTTTVPAASKSKPIWRNSASVQALAAGTSYTTVKTVLGNEFDYPSGGTTQPTNQVQLNPTSLTFTGKGANSNGTVYTTSPGALTFSFTMYRRSSGALVFNTGAWRGWWGVGRWNGNTIPTGNGTLDLDWQNALLAILYDLGQTPQTLRALRDGSDTALTNPATGAPGGTRDNVASAYGLAAAGTVSATLAGTGSLAAAATMTVATLATLAGAGTLNAASTSAVAATLTAAGALAATPTLVQTATAALTGTGALTGTPSAATTATLSGAGSLNATPASAVTTAFAGAGALTSAPSSAATDTLTGSGALTAAATSVQTVTTALTGAGSLGAAAAGASSATLTGAGTLAASSAIVLPVTATLAGSGSLSGSGASATTAILAGTGALSAVPAVTAITNLTGSGSLAAAGSPAVAATMAGTGGLVATPSGTATVALAGSGALTASAAAVSSVTFAGAGALTATPTLIVATAASLTGSGSLTSTAAAATSSTLAGAGALVASRTLAVLASAVLAGSGSVTAAGSTATTSTLAGSGTLAATATVAASVALTGAGALTSSAVNATATTFTGSGALTASPTLTLAASVALTGAGSLTSPATTATAATLTGSGALAASAFAIQQATISLGGAGSLTASAIATAGGGFILAGQGALAAASSVTAFGSATLAGSGNLAAGATTVLSGTSALAGAGALVATPVVGGPATATLTGAGSLAAASASTVSVLLAGSGTLAATPTVTQAASFTLTGAGQLTAATSAATAATLTGAGSLTASSSVTQPAAASLAGAGSLTGAAISTAAGGITLTGQGTLTGTPTTVVSATAALTGTGTLGVTPAATAAVTFAGSGALVAAATLALQAAAVLAGSGSLTAAGSATSGQSAVLAGAGQLAAAATLIGQAVAVLAGTGSLAATPVGAQPVTGTLTGSGSLTAAAVSVAQASVLLAGAGALVSVAQVAQAATLTGSGSLTAGASQTLRATATLTGAGMLTASAGVLSVATGVRPFHAGTPVVLAAYHAATPTSSRQLHAGTVSEV